MNPTPETHAARIFVGTSRMQYVPAEICEAIERQRNEHRTEIAVLKSALASTQAQLVKARIQRERFHAQLRRGSTLPPDHV
jgi:hypothetical protein